MEDELTGRYTLHSRKIHRKEVRITDRRSYMKTTSEEDKLMATSQDDHLIGRQPGNIEIDY